MKTSLLQRVVVICVPVFAITMLVGCPSGSPPNGDGTGDGTDNGTGNGTTGAVCGIGMVGPTTHVESDITADTTWTAAGSPHIITQSITIENGATLTIEPCAFVELSPNVHIVVGLPTLDEAGTLLAVGTMDEPIQFSANTTERWKNVRVLSTGSAQLAYVTFMDGGSDEITYDGATLVVEGDGQLPLRQNTDVQNVTIQGSAGYGLLLSRFGGFTDASANLTITGSGATLAEFPNPVHGDVQLYGTLPSGDYTGNATDEFFVLPRQGVVEDTTLRNLGIPYHIDGVAWTTLRIDEGAVLTVEAGVTMKFDSDLYFRFGSSITSGALHATGTPSNPIVFTSAAAAPQPGDWVGIAFDEPPPAGTTNILDNVRIEYAGGSCSCGGFACPSNVSDDSAILIFDWLPATSFLTNSVISDCAGNGILRGWSDATCGSGPTDFTGGNTFTNVASCAQTTPVPVSPDCSSGCPTVTCP